MQYYQGKDNSLPYRIARRDAHNCDAELASVISNMSAEPKNDKETQEAAFRLLCLNHTMLSYISALGAHREKLSNTATLNLLNDAICYVEGTLEQEQPDGAKMAQVLASLSTRLQNCNPEPESKDQLVLQQIGLLLELLPELSELNRRIGQAN